MLWRFMQPLMVYWPLQQGPTNLNIVAYTTLQALASEELRELMPETLLFHRNTHSHSRLLAHAISCGDLIL